MNADANHARRIIFDSRDPDERHSEESVSNDVKEPTRVMSHHVGPHVRGKVR